MDFDRFGFDPEFEVEIDPEFPGDGEWGCPVYGFDSMGQLVDAFTSRWGSPVIVMARPTGRDPWVGMFPSGGLGSGSQVFACPGPNHLGVMAGGDVYVIDVLAPSQDASVVPVSAVQQVEGIAGTDLLLLVRQLNIVALGGDGVQWTTPRLCLDDLRIVAASAGSIVCSVFNLDGTDENDEIELDPTTGEQTRGTRFDSHSPS
ncbi:MAG: hypothetical protein JWM89_1490 [Acidimicrobiales bacterium]|nr:hypothetical protein [Acidimicrobiales bacterium]